ncbi:MAG: 1-(5-phosphoribosyl)-5-[(5-phosphoribosylamino)methylideneamino] imidazole-4-carboxamide isomerase [Acidobacteriaceae bacterium]|nr:1-(5-phosphoribosyl)-5-[(5-phosphoribosylamino)methylideneamino] imidazole-4-carboxamide isomerase [Acidobacteriaceae bacterium]
MLIPSIDLMGGKIVQLIQGKKKALEFNNFEEWIERFSNFSMVQLIDLDAAIGSGDNRDILQQFLKRLPCQVGGGIGSIQIAQQILGLGARRVILGSSLVRDGKINAEFAEEASTALDADKLVFAVDAKGGKVAIHGWRELTAISPVEMVRSLERWCEAFLYTHIDTEGMMRGIPKDIVRSLREATSKQLIVAGGISTNEEIEELDKIGADGVVGMALYLGKLDIEAARQ